MNILQKITEGLMSPNEMLTNIITIPFFVIEAYIYINLFFTLFSKQPPRKNKYICIMVLLISGIFSRFIISIPYNTIFNIIIFVISYQIFFKAKLIEAVIGVSINSLLTVLFEMISTQIYTLLFGKPYSEYANYPLYTVLFMIIVYTSLFIMLKLFKKFDVNITLFKNINKKDTITILVTIILGLITVFLQLYISTLYNNILPNFVTLLSIICLIAYFFVSLFNIVKTKQLEIANRDINNLQLYNNTLNFFNFIFINFKKYFIKLCFLIICSCSCSHF